MASEEYMNAVIELCREKLGAEAFKEIHETAKRKAGGKRRHMQKAETPLSEMGYGYGSTLVNAPMAIKDVDYRPGYYDFCETCAFNEPGDICSALQIPIMPEGVCDAYIDWKIEFGLQVETARKRAMHPSALNKAEETLEVPEKPTGDDLEKVEFQVKFASVDEERRIVYGIVMEPDEVDAHKEYYNELTVEKAAHNFAMTEMQLGRGHKFKADARVIETFIAPVDFELGGQPVKKGSWVMASKVFSDTIWEGIKKGDYTGYSIGAMCRKVKVNQNAAQDDPEVAGE